MPIRDEVHQLAALGPLEPEDTIEQGKLESLERLLDQISRPVSDDEARALLSLFGPADTCYGLAWTLVHLIETAPGWPLWDALQRTENYWIRHLRSTAENAGLTPPRDE